MMLNEQVFVQALAMAGPLDDRQSALLQMLCRSCAAELAAKLKQGLTPLDCQADFVCAASLAAVAALSEAGETETVDSFTAGDMTVHRTRNSAAANCLRNQARMMMMPYIRDSFSFLGV